MNKKILFLDYDGVLFDTLKEVYLVNRFLYLGKSYFEELDKENYEKYSKFKYLIYNIWMFYYYNPLIFENSNNIEEDFKSALLNRNLQKEEIYCEEFLDVRSELIKTHYDFWKSLETPYDFFLDIKNLYNSKNINLAIVSKKNKSSILEKFKAHDFNLDEKFVFAREVLDKYPTKKDFMLEYMKENGFEEAIFVDDNFNNIKPALNCPKIKTILALWGNSEPNKEGLEQKEAFHLINNFL